MYRLDAGDVERLRVRPHVRRFVECAWRLGGYRHLQPLRLRRWAHSLGFRGHCFTKSRRYSTTFTALRQARHEHVLELPARPRATRRSASSARCGSGTTAAGLPNARATRGSPSRAQARARAAAGRARGASHQTGARARRVRREAHVSQIEGRRSTSSRRSEVAERVGLSPETILRYYREGRIPGRRLPGSGAAGALPVERGRGGVGLRSPAHARGCGVITMGARTNRSGRWRR